MHRYRGVWRDLLPTPATARRDARARTNRDRTGRGRAGAWCARRGTRDRAADTRAGCDERDRPSRCVIAAAGEMLARYAAGMTCQRCGDESDRLDEQRGRLVYAEDTRLATPWCRECETQYFEWVRQYAADIIWQTGVGAIVAMLIGLGLPLLGLPPIIGIAGVLVGLGTFIGLRQWSKQRRRRQFLAGALPRAYLPSRT